MLLDTIDFKVTDKHLLTSSRIRAQIGQNPPPRPTNSLFATWTGPDWASLRREHMLHRARSTLFRLAVNRLPTSRTLCKMGMESVPSPVCRVCKVRDEDDLHLLFFCPFKVRTWIESWRAIFVDPINGIGDVLNALENQD